MEAERWLSYSNKRDLLVVGKMTPTGLLSLLLSPVIAIRAKINGEEGALWATGSENQRSFEAGVVIPIILSAGGISPKSLPASLDDMWLTQPGLNYAEEHHSANVLNVAGGLDRFFHKHTIDKAIAYFNYSTEIVAKQQD